MTLTSPSPLQALDRMEYAMINAVAPPDVRIVSPHFIVSSHSPSVPGYTQKLTPGFLLLSNYLLLALLRPDPFLLPFIPPPQDTTGMSSSVTSHSLYAS